MATIFELAECFGKRKRQTNHTCSDGSISSSSMSHSDATSSRYEQQQEQQQSTASSSSSGPDNNHDESCGGRQKNCSQSNTTTYNSSDEEKYTSDCDCKPAALSTSFSRTTKTITTAPFLMLGSDVMISVVSFLDPKETLNILTMPICKEWRLSYTSDQDLWRTICSTDPFSADLDISSTSAIDADNDDDDDDDDSFCSLNTGFNCDTGGTNNEGNNVLGEYRLVYTSFVRCMNYLNRIQNDDQNNVQQPSSSVKDDHNNNNNDTSRVSRFPTFGVTKSLKKFLAKSKECGVLKSVIGTGNGTHSDNSASAPIGVSADGRTIHRSFSKMVSKEMGDTQKPKFGQSMITSRVLGPSAMGVPSHLNLPKSCAIYSIVNWMVAHPNVRGIQTMCIMALPSLLEDEQQRITAQRIGMVEVVLCAMLRFPDNVKVHIAAFHTIVLLARPLGGREGMLFDNSMAGSTQNVDLTSFIETSTSTSTAAHYSRIVSLQGSNRHTSNLLGNSSSHTNIVKDKENKLPMTGIGILIDSMKRFASSEKLQSTACWALVNVALVPAQKSMLMKLNGIEAILDAMTEHSKSFDVQFRALFALINLVVPCRESDSATNDSNTDANEATRTEKAVLTEWAPRIAQLAVLAMKNFCSSETILNRGCLVIHNLSQSPEFMVTLLRTPHCYQILEWCVTNYSTDVVIRRSVSSTLNRMLIYLDQNPEEQRRFSLSMEGQNREVLEQQHWQ